MVACLPYGHTEIQNGSKLDYDYMSLCHGGFGQPSCYISEAKPLQTCLQALILNYMKIKSMRLIIIRGKILSTNFW